MKLVSADRRVPAWLGAFVRLMVLGLVLITPARALAAVSVEAPSGWEEDTRALPQARQRAQSWATAAGYRLLSAWSTTTEDEYVETLALLEVPAALASDAVETEAGARAVLTSAASLVVDSTEEPSDFRIELSEIPGAPILRGTWETPETTTWVALAPSGPVQILLVMSTKTSEAALYRNAFSGTVDSLQGITPPVSPFPRDGWRLGGLLGWIIVTLGAFVSVALTADVAGDHRNNARRASLIIFVLAIAAGVIVYTLLADKEVSLSLADVDRSWMTIEIVGIGLLFAAILFVASLGGSRDAVKSAPTQGVYAGRISNPSLPRLYDPDAPASPTEASDAAEPATPREPTLDLPDVGEAQLEGHAVGDLAPDPVAAQLTTPLASDEMEDEPTLIRQDAAVPRGVVRDNTPIPHDSVSGAYGLAKTGRDTQPESERDSQRSTRRNVPPPRTGAPKRRPPPAPPRSTSSGVPEGPIRHEPTPVPHDAGDDDLQYSFSKRKK